MVWGSLSSWLGFGVTVVVILGGQYVQSKIQRVKIFGRLDRVEKDVEKNTQCIASIKKRSTDFLPVRDFQDHTKSCKADRREESRRKDTELNRLSEEVTKTHESVESVARKVDQLLALQSGKVQ